MVKVHNRLPLLVAFVAVLFFSAPLFAQDWRDYRAPYSSEAQQRAYNNGYHEGQERGRDDGRHDRVADYTRDKEYRRADEGYKDRYGDREWYRNEFRRGYVAGYTRAYNQYAPRRYRYDDRGIGYGYPAPRYEGRAIPRAYYPQYDDRVNRGYNKGYEDGLKKGRDDERHRRAADPRRHDWYRDGDRGYDRDDDGPRANYIAAYRDGFLNGYAAGYDERRY